MTNVTLSDNGHTETHDSLDDAADAAMEWYCLVDEWAIDVLEIPDVPDGCETLEDLNNYIDSVKEAVAIQLGYRDNGGCNAASLAGLSLSATIEE